MIMKKFTKICLGIFGVAAVASVATIVATSYVVYKKKCGSLLDSFSLTEEDLGDNKYYILPDSTVRVTFFRGRPVSVEIDTFVNLKVIETQPNIRGDTATGGGKPATLETGLVITVPFHVNLGEVLKIDTRTNKYIEKVK